MFGIDEIINIGGKLIDRLWPDPAQRDAAKLKLVELQQTGELQKMQNDLEQSKIDAQLAQGQIEINKIEAASDSLFKSGWRPFIGWVLGASFVYDFLLRPLLNGILVKYGFAFIELDSATLTSLTGALLGLGAMRSWDKFSKK